MSENTFPIAVDIGATKTVIAVFRDGSMSEIDRFLTLPTPEEQVDRIGSVVRREHLLDGATAMGIGSPGPLDPFKGVILAPPNMPGWRNFPLAQRISDDLGIPVKLENDATVGALGESVHGSGAGYNSMYYLTISTGIGGGFIMNGRIFGGQAGIAGEVYAVEPGHFQGRPGDVNLNELASGPGLIRCAKRRLAAGEQSSLNELEEGWNTPELFAAVDAGDPVAVATLEDGRNAIAGFITTMLYAVAPEAIVLAGGLCTEGHWYVDPVRERVRKWLVIPELHEVPIERAKLWDKAVLYGAAELVS